MIATTRTCTIQIEGISPYSQSDFFTSAKREKESHEEYEERCWRERMHLSKDGHVVIPQMSIKYAVDEACKRLALQVPGEGKTRYTKYFEAGWMVPEQIVTNIKGDDVEGEWLWMSSTGQKGKGGGRRVRRCYPHIPKGWGATLNAVILDEKIPDDVFEKCFVSAGLYVGVGRFRPENQGYYGRFTPLKIEWS